VLLAQASLPVNVYWAPSHKSWLVKAPKKINSTPGKPKFFRLRKASCTSWTDYYDELMFMRSKALTYASGNDPDVDAGDVVCPLSAPAGSSEDGARVVADVLVA
jgi:hypothetical protein